MGKIRVKTLGLEEVEKKQKKDAAARREAKTFKRELRLSSDERTQGEKIKKGKADVEEITALSDKEVDTNLKEEKQTAEPAKKETKKESKPAKKIKEKKVGKNYKRAFNRVKKNTTYKLTDALKLLKEITYVKFDETVELHINLKESNVKGEVNLPYGIGKAIRAVVFEDSLIDEIEKGLINFDVLIARPLDMPKLAKFAKVLGPKGLMPNPKSGTVSDDPEKALKRFGKGTIRYKSEANMPLIHQAVGKMSFGERDLVENITTFITAVGEEKISQIFIKSTMSPSIRVEV